MNEHRDRPEPGDRPDRNQHVFFAPSSFRRRREERRKRALAIGGGVLVLLLAIGGAWFWLRSDPDADPTGATEARVGGEPTERTPAGDTADEPAIDLPELDASDELVRRMAQGLSERPGWAEWLVTDDLAWRFVASVTSVAAGASPASHVEFMAPNRPFEARESEDGIYVDPESYRRYDLPVAIFASLDTDASAELYRRLRPLFEEAHQELGFPAGTFDDTFARAVENILALEVPEGPVALETGDALYEYRDPRLESGSEAQKHLLRLGPDNARRVQQKLRELSDALGLNVES